MGLALRYRRACWASAYRFCVAQPCPRLYEAFHLERVTTLSGRQKSGSHVRGVPKGEEPRGFVAMARSRGHLNLGVQPRDLGVWGRNVMDGAKRARPTYTSQGSERLKSFSDRSQNCVLCDYVYGCMRHTHSSIIYLLDRVCSQLHLALVASATRAGARLVHEARVGFALPRIRLRTVRCRWLVSAVLVVGWCGGWWQRQHAEAHPFLAARVQVGAELRG